MNVLLVRPPDPLQEVELLSHTRPMNLAYLAAYLRRHGLSVSLVDYELEPFSPDSFAALLRKLRPALLGVSCTTPSVAGGARICAAAKSVDQRIVTVVGGPHANGLPVETLEEFPAFDFLVYGEGEITLFELCRTLRDGGSFAAVAGLVHRQEEKIVQNPPRPLVAELDSLPLPARDLFAPGRQAGHVSRGFANSLRSAELFTSRGCPFSCSFCAIQATFGRRVRFHGTERIAAEVAGLVRNHGCNHIVIADDTFSLDPERALEICRILGAGGIDSWNCDTRVASVTPRLLRAMARSGCRKVAFGVESGSQRVVDLMGKGISIEKVEAAVRWAREAGIPHIEGNFIIGGDPSETPAEIEATKKLITTLPWTFVSVSIIVPYPGTPVYDRMRAAGQIDAHAPWEDFVMFGRTPRWRTDHFDAADLISLQRSLTRAFYLRPGYIAARLGQIRPRADGLYWFRAGAAYLKWYLHGKL